MARVSILLTCYNHRAHLEEAVQSIARQTFADYEVIALDDGSTDGSREWLSEQTLVPMHLLFSESNLGTYASLNRGLRAASGELIAILNDDDVWGPEKLARQAAVMDEKPRCGLVATGGHFIDGAGQSPAASPLGFPYPVFEDGDRALDLVYRNLSIASAALFRRAALPQFDEGFFGSGDWDAWMEIAQNWELAHVRGDHTFYRIHAGSASHQSDKIMHDDVRLREKFAVHIAGWSGRFPAADLRAADAHNQACLGAALARVGKREEARRAYRRSLALMPGRVKTWARYGLSLLGK